MKTQFDAFNDTIAGKSTFVITTHINPDGDAIGSETALASFLRDRGKTVRVINQSPTPDNLEFLSTEIFPVECYDAVCHSGVIRSADCFIVVDTNAVNRFFALADDVAACTGMKICIDHHLEPEAFADMYIVDAEAPATGELLYRLFAAIDEASITTPIARALYTGIMTDTGSFRFPKTDVETHLITADLLRRGADPSQLYQAIYDSSPVNRLHLLGRALDSIRSIEGGSVTWMTLRQADFDATKTVGADTDNLINYTLSIAGVRIGLMFTEFDGVIKVSFRSKGDISINHLAKEFGGNGHKHAAGARLPGRKLEEIVDLVTERARTYIK